MCLLMALMAFSSVFRLSLSPLSLYLSFYLTRFHTLSVITQCLFLLLFKREEREDDTLKGKKQRRKQNRRWIFLQPPFLSLASSPLFLPYNPQS